MSQSQSLSKTIRPADVAAVGHITPVIPAEEATITITKDQYIDSLRRQRLALQKNNTELEAALEYRYKKDAETKKELAEANKLIRQMKRMQHKWQQVIGDVMDSTDHLIDETTELCTMVDEEGANFKNEQNYIKSMDKMMKIHNNLKGQAVACLMVWDEMN